MSSEEQTGTLAVSSHEPRVQQADSDPSVHHLSDKQHFKHSPNPQELDRGLGVYSSSRSGYEKCYRTMQNSPGMQDDGN